MNNTKYVERMVNNADRILVDTSTLMRPGFCKFINDNKELFLNEGKRIIVPKSVYTELARLLQSDDEEKVNQAVEAIALLKNNEIIFQVAKSTLTDEEISIAFADPELLSDLTLHKQKYSQLLITNDQKLGSDAYDLNQQESCKGRRVYVCYITKFGELQRCECVQNVVESKIENESKAEKVEQTQKAIPHEQITNMNQIHMPNSDSETWKFDWKSALVGCLGAGSIFLLCKFAKAAYMKHSFLEVVR